jgi:hypothetical protein
MISVFWLLAELFAVVSIPEFTNFDELMFVIKAVNLERRLVYLIVNI